MGAEGGLAFAPTEIIWVMINLILLLLLIGLSIWLIRKTYFQKTRR